MGYHGANQLQLFKDCEIVSDRRYVYDITFLFNFEYDPDNIYQILNKPHPNIKFSFEKQ